MGNNVSSTKTLHFDLVSDFHFNDWYKVSSSPTKTERQVSAYLKRILPVERNPYLIIVGDIGNYNQQNKVLLSHLSKLYKQVLIVWGNHDYNLKTNSLKAKYKTWQNRIQDMESFIESNLRNVTILKGLYILEGFKILGYPVWFDLEYELVSGRSSTLKEAFAKWRLKARDGSCFESLPHPEGKDVLSQLIPSADMVITHVLPTWKIIEDAYPTDAFFGSLSFSGDDLVSKAKGKLWLVGHAHVCIEREYNGVQFLSNPIARPKSLFSINKVTGVKDCVDVKVIQISWTIEYFTENGVN